MRRIIPLVLALVMCLSLCACSGDTGTANKEENTKVAIGEIASTDLFECTLTRAEFAPRLANVMDEGYLLPDGSYGGTTPYVADKGSVYLSFVFELSYLGTEEFDFELGKVESKDLDWMNFLAKYDNSYEFSSFSIAGSVDGTWEDLPYDISGTYMTSLSSEAFSFKPLEDGSHEFRGYIQVSDKVLEEDGKPVDLIITLCDKEIVYSIK